MNCGHLFNGIGGFGLAASWMGWSNVMHCEIDPFCNRVMNYHFPNSYQHEDIRTTDFTIWRGRIDILTGGDPCQPSSNAGKRKGKEDQRYLWPENKRAIREILPGWVVNENVPGTISNGILDEKISDLEALGYACWPPFVIPASAVGAPHKRDRVWLIAYTSGRRHSGRETLKKGQQHDAGWHARRIASSPGSVWAAANSDLIERPEGWVYQTGSEEAERYTGSCDSWNFGDAWQKFPTQPPVCTGNDGISAGLADLTFSKWRNESLKALGNAIVPQVAYQIFKAIEQYENL